MEGAEDESIRHLLYERDVIALHSEYKTIVKMWENLLHRFALCDR